MKTKFVLLRGPGERKSLCATGRTLKQQMGRQERAQGPVG